MKRQIFFLLFFSLSMQLIGQQASEKEYLKHLKKIEKSKKENTTIASLDTIYSNGNAYAILRKANAINDDYSLRNLNGKELVYFRLNSFDNTNHTANIGSVEKKYYYEVIFLDSRRQCEIESFMYQELAKFIVNNDLIQNNLLNEAAVQKLVEERSKTYSLQKNKPVQVFKSDSNVVEYDLVERDKTTLIELKAFQILQGGKIIGSFETGTNNNGFVEFTYFKFYIPEGNKIAYAKYQSFGDEDIEVTTEKDGKIFLLIRPTYNIESFIVQYLVDHGYL